MTTHPKRPCLSGLAAALLALLVTFGDASAQAPDRFLHLAYDHDSSAPLESAVVRLVKHGDRQIRVIFVPSQQLSPRVLANVIRFAVLAVEAGEVRPDRDAVVPELQPALEANPVVASLARRFSKAELAELDGYGEVKLLRFPVTPALLGR